MTYMNKRMKTKNECVNRIYCVCLQYKLLFIYRERHKRVRKSMRVKSVL